MKKDQISIQEIAKECAKDYSLLKNHGVDKDACPPRQWIRAWMQTNYNIIKLSGYFYREFEKALNPKKLINENKTSLGLNKQAKKKFNDIDAIDNINDYVDLGLPSGTLWCSHNFGVDNEHECGNLYNYDDAIKLDLLSGHLPSHEDFKELNDFCKHKISEINGIRGMLFISKINSNKIFFPIADYYDGLTFYFKPYGYYWSSETYGNDAAYNMKFDLSSFDLFSEAEDGWVNVDNTSYRSYGFLVRDVLKKANESTNLGLNQKAKKKHQDIDVIDNISGDYVDLGLPSGNLWCTHNYRENRNSKDEEYYSYDDAIHLDFPLGTLPSRDDFEELVNNCEHHYVEIDGEKGQIFTSKINGETVFFPLAGYKHKSKGPTQKYGICGHCWSSTSKNGYRNVGDAYNLIFYSDNAGIYANKVNPRNTSCKGFNFSVRTIIKKANESMNLGLNKRAKSKFNQEEALDQQEFNDINKTVTTKLIAILEELGFKKDMNPRHIDSSELDVPTKYFTYTLYESPLTYNSSEKGKECTSTLRELFVFIDNNDIEPEQHEKMILEIRINGDIRDDDEPEAGKANVGSDRYDDYGWCGIRVANGMSAGVNDMRDRKMRPFCYLKNTLPVTKNMWLNGIVESTDLDIYHGAEFFIEDMKGIFKTIAAFQKDRMKGFSISFSNNTAWPEFDKETWDFLSKHFRKNTKLLRQPLYTIQESNISLGLNKQAKKIHKETDAVKNLHMEFVDLGLPSGNLWKNINEGSVSIDDGGKGFTYDEAIKSKFDEGILPNEDDFKELYASCKFEWDDEKKGMTVTSNINGNSIFLPAPGYIGTIGRMENPGKGTYGCYWMLPGESRNASPNKGSGFSFMISEQKGVMPFHVDATSSLYCVRCISRNANESINLGLNKRAKDNFKGKLVDERTAIDEVAPTYSCMDDAGNPVEVTRSKEVWKNRIFEWLLENVKNLKIKYDEKRQQIGREEIKVDDFIRSYDDGMYISMYQREYRVYMKPTYVSRLADYFNGTIEVPYPLTLTAWNIGNYSRADVQLWKKGNKWRLTVDAYFQDVSYITKRCPNGRWCRAKKTVTEKDVPALAKLEL